MALLRINKLLMKTKKINSIRAIGILAFCVVILFMTFSFPVSSAEQTASDSSIAQETALQRQRSDIEIDQIKQNISSLVSAGKFHEAEKEYDYISKLYDSLGDTRVLQIKRSLLQSEKNIFYKKWADYLEDQAANAFLNKEYDKSIKLSEESIGVIKKINIKPSPENGKEPFVLFEPKTPSKPNAAAQEQLIQDSTYAKLNDKFAQETNLDAALPQYKYRVMDLDTYLTDAQGYMKNKEYDKAKVSLEKALLLDPYNYKAMTMLQSLYTQLLTVGKARAQTEEYEAIAETQWLNNEAVLPNVSGEEELRVIEAQSDDMNKLKAKLNSMIIPKVDFEDASISSVMAYLSRESKIADEKEGKGINIILRLSNTQQEPKTITMQLDDVPIGEIIRYVCLSTGLKFRIEEDAVVIGDDSIDQMKTQFFQIRSGLINSIISNLNVDNKTITSDDKEFYDTKTLLSTSIIQDQKVMSSDLQAYFIKRGLPFPHGANIAWDSKTSMLVITNTPENIRIAESLIKEIDVNIPLVLIETKFIEITQIELEELAFKWKLQYAGNKTIINPNDAGTASEGNDEIIRHFTNPTTNNQYALINDLAFNKNGVNFNFWMYAIDQSKTVEVLSSPKVITKSGSEALIRMVTERYYPNSWTKPEVTAQAADAGTNTSITFSGPEFTDPTDLGIILYATPTVSPNNHTILLDLKPQVIDFIGWDDFSYAIQQTTGSDTLNIKAPVKMAQISHRDVTTKVKIYDGETIVLGGTIKENAIYVDDSMPFLSDVPLAGRLFRSKYQDIERKNLLIFVSARLVNPDGTPFRKQSNKLFDFGR